MSSRKPDTQSKYRLAVLLIAGAVVALGLGWWQTQRGTVVQSLSGNTLVQNAPYTVTVRPSQDRIQAGDTVRLTFTAYREGLVSDIYQDQRVMHYVIASANYRDFLHTYAPEVSGPGEFYLDHTFTQPGPYRIWTELVDTTKGKDTHHGEHAELISYVDLNVTGTQPSANLSLVTASAATVGKWRVVTEQTGLQAGSPTRIRMHVEDSTGTVLPVFPAEPAIYVMVGPAFEFFRHTHTEPAVQEKFIEISETFPAPGQYLFFTEVYVKEGEAYQVLQVPFAVTIE